MRTKWLSFAAFSFLLLAVWQFWPKPKASLPTAEIEAEEIQSEPDQSIIPKHYKTVIEEDDALQTRNPTNQKIVDYDEQEKCFERLFSAYQARCQGSCLKSQAENANSWVSRWIEDGWVEESDQISPDQTTDMGKFYYALGLADLLNGRSIEEKNPDKALEMLTALNEKDPTNSIYAVYAAVIENQRGNVAAAKEYLDYAKRNGTKFDSHLTALARQLQKDAGHDQLTRIEAISLFSRAPIPNYNEMVKTVREVDSNPKVIAELVMKETIEHKDEKADLNWIAVEYAMGRNLFGLKGDEADARYPEPWKIIRAKGTNDTYWTVGESEQAKSELCPTAIQ